MGIVTTIPEAGLDYMLYGDNSNFISGYLYNQLANIPVAFNQFSQRIHDALQASYNYVTDVATKAGIFNELRNQGFNVNNDYLQELTTFEQLQNANVSMQRWVMTHPDVRKLYLKQDIDGYSDSYKNIFGKGVAEQDYNYRRVMNGVIVDEDKDKYRYSIYDDLLIPGDRELDHREKMIILNTWNAIDNILAESNFDFTCKSDEPVKINRS